MSKRLEPGKYAARYVVPATGWKFSAHGTAIAGLIGARPVSAQGLPVESPNKVSINLPFAGVDPFCRIVPISTNFDPDPEQLIFASMPNSSMPMLSWFQGTYPTRGRTLAAWRRRSVFFDFGIFSPGSTCHTSLRLFSLLRGLFFLRRFLCSGDWAVCPLGFSVFQFSHYLSP
ncbi:hypothetical protein G6N74_25710 [Mesorhizobium sp. CGMCC 1.15528]|uniref:Uncharacterized protein n=1 Tax=Mesorhizobium zhangyense TaxID=1776730 RepID=A0A7C9VH30_9HYPH|nr:hypothetical protein [Mesorhizobium zhangyense]NGN44470.1 hypothetical protein [Mesorhizobium zhangyense]